MKARTYKSVQSKPYNTLQKTEGPSQIYQQNILFSMYRIYSSKDLLQH